MSLQVWYPLLGDLHNQGLSAQTANVSSTPVWATIGKIGGKSLYTNTRQTTMYFPGLVGVSTYSVAYWLYIPTATAPTAWSDIFGIQFNCAGTTAWERDERRAATTTGRHNYHLAKSASEGSTEYTYYPTREDDSANDNWVHYVLTKDNTSARLYANGVLVVTVPRANFESTVRTMTGNVYFGDSGCEAYLNDFRIYDHCLTENEVKRLAQGLFLHYKLDNNGWGGENMMAYDSACTDYLNLTNNNFSLTTEGGVKCAHATGALQTTARLTTKVGFIPQPNEYATFSAYVKIKNVVRGTTNPMCEFYFAGQTIDGTWRSVNYKKFTVDGKEVPHSVIGFDQSVSFNINDNAWHYVTATCQYQNYEFTSTFYPSIYFRDCTGDMYIHHIKFERGQKATPWSPHPGDAAATTTGYNSGIEYDISGFGYNGTHVGSLDWSSDSPKYSASTVFDGASYIVTTPEWMTQGAEEYTISIWAYMDDWANYPGRMYSCIQTGGFCDEKSGSNLQWAIHTYSNAEQTTAAYTSGTYCTYPFASITPGWHMFTWTYTTSVIKGYIDGEVVSTKTITTYGIHFNTNALLALGAESAGATITSPYFTGKLSDFRLYATALSANDVKSLYQNSAYIDSNGIIHGAIR